MLKEVDKPEGVAVGGLRYCPVCEARQWCYYLIPVGKGYHYCPHCEGWFEEVEDEAV